MYFLFMGLGIEIGVRFKFEPFKLEELFKIEIARGHFSIEKLLIKFLGRINIP